MQSALGQSPANKGRRYPADPPRVEEIVAVMRRAGDGPYGLRLRGLIVVLWRSGLRITEALDLNESDLDLSQGAILVRSGKGRRRGLPVGSLFCVIRSDRCGAPWSTSAVRGRFRVVARQAGVRRRFAPHQLRHAHAVEMAREGVPLNVIQRQLGHANLGVTSVYLQGIDTSEIIDTVRSRQAPVIPAAAALLA